MDKTLTDKIRIIRSLIGFPVTICNNLIRATFYKLTSYGSANILLLSLWDIFLSFFVYVRPFII